MRPFSLDLFVYALECREYNRAAEIATSMSESIKRVAREIWRKWEGSEPGF